MTTFTEARQLTKAANAEDWDGRGTYVVAGFGYEDEKAFLMVEGAAEFIVGGDESYVQLDPELTLVSKETGALLYTRYMDARDVIDAMTPVGVFPPHWDA